MIGIDRYGGSWNRLQNAVSDASEILRLFQRLGFTALRAPLFDDLATGDALRRLVTDDLAALGEDDSLVLFFAGHGHTLTRTYPGGASVKDGYIIPSDAAPPGSGTATWVRLESWLADVSRSPAKHILVFLDTCHSGIALGPIIRWRGNGVTVPHREPLADLRARRSRRVITSALDNQLAMDGGPVPGHSLFTGCIIEALTGGIAVDASDGLVTGSEIGQYVQRRVSGYPGSAQTPDFGSIELDDRGELVFSVRPARGDIHQPAPVPRPEPAGPGRVTEPPVKRTSARKLALVICAGAAAASGLAILAMSLANHPGRAQTSAATSAPAAPPSAATLAPAAPPSVRTVAVDAAGASPGAVTDPVGGAAPAPRPADLPTAPGAPSTGAAVPKQRPSSVVRRRDVDHPPPPAEPLDDAPDALASAPAREPTASSSAPAGALLPAPSVRPASQVPSGCRKDDFAAVYAAQAPARDTVRAALRNLKLCRDAGLISSDEFDRYQTALVAKI